MKSVKSIILVALGVVFLYAVVRTVIPRRQGVPETTSKPKTLNPVAESSRRRSTVERSAQSRVAISPIRPRASAPQDPAPSVNEARREPVKAENPAQGSKRAQDSKQKAARGGTTQKAAGAGQGAPRVPQVLQDPMARVALAFVGADPGAEMYWYEAINDPRLSAHERQDLIEDLNEDGLSDPQNPTMEDLPLILSRIQLIEEVYWDAMDEVNADAFQEAYKDLVNLAAQALSNG